MKVERITSIRSDVPEVRSMVATTKEILAFWVGFGAFAAFAAFAMTLLYLGLR